MATSAYSSRSLLPWQASPSTVNYDGEDYVLDLLDPSGRPSHRLVLSCSGISGRWRWLVIAFTPGAPVVAESRPEGYTRPHLAERALMFKLPRVLHANPCLPASLPPQEGAISASRRGE